MSIKLFKLRTYLNITEASQYLTEGIGEPVSEAEVVRLALNKYLQFSIVLKELEFGRYGKLVDSIGDAPICYTTFDGCLEFGEKISNNILPILDLAMVGQEVELLKDLYYEYSKESFDYCEYVNNSNTVILKDADSYFELFEIYDYNSSFGGAEACLDNVSINSPFIDRMRADNARDRVKFLQENDHEYIDDHIYVPAVSFPVESNLIITIQELDRFIDGFNSDSVIDDQNAKPLGSREKNTLLVLIATLCKESNIDYSKRGIASAITLATEKMGVKISEDTIRKVLKEIPNALESKKH